MPKWVMRSFKPEVWAAEKWGPEGEMFWGWTPQNYLQHLLEKVSSSNICQHRQGLTQPTQEAYGLVKSIYSSQVLWNQILALTFLKRQEKAVGLMQTI